MNFFPVLLLWPAWNPPLPLHWPLRLKLKKKELISVQFNLWSNKDVPGILLVIMKVKQVLKSGGAAREFYISDLVTHVISTDTNFPQYSEAKDCNLTIVQVHMHIHPCLLFFLLVFKILLKVFAIVRRCPIAEV